MTYSHKGSLTLFIVHLASCVCWTQPSITCLKTILPAPPPLEIQDPKGLCDHRDNLMMRLSDFITTLKEKGYLASSLDSVVQKKDSLYAFVSYGPRYRMGEVHMDSILKALLDKVTIKRIKALEGTYVSPQSLKRGILESLVEEGYLKAKVGIDPVFVSDTVYHCVVHVTIGDKMINGDVLLSNDSIVSLRFLKNHLFWRKAEPFHPRSLDLVKRRMGQLSFIQLYKDPEVRLEYNEAHIFLPIKDKKSNSFDFILGVLPNMTNDQRKVILSVYLNTVLENALKQGEKMSIQFINTKPKTQDLSIQLEYPYVSSWPFGVNAGLQMYRNEDTHLNLDYDLGMIWQTPHDYKYSAYWKRSASTLLNPDTAFLRNYGRLPEDLDYVTHKIGLDIQWHKLDNLLIPRRGVLVKTSLTVGQKMVGKNESLLNIDLDTIAVEALYNDITPKGFQSELGYVLEGYIPLSKRWTFKSSVRGQHLLGQGAYLKNELYRIGGSKLLRGFDEQFFQVNQYTLFSFEARFFLDGSSYFSAFYDLGFLVRDSFNQNFKGWASGLGLGMNVQTDVGVFNLSYAVGSGLGTQYDLNTGKIHLGYVNLF